MQAEDSSIWDRITIKALELFLEAEKKEIRLFLNGNLSFRTPKTSLEQEESEPFDLSSSFWQEICKKLELGEVLETEILEKVSWKLKDSEMSQIVDLIQAFEYEKALEKIRFHEQKQCL